MKSDLRAERTVEFVRLLTNCQGGLHAFIASLMPGHPDTADVLQETNLTLWEKMQEFEPGSNFQAWAFSVARFKALTKLKKSRNLKSIHFDEDVLVGLESLSANRTPDRYAAKVRALEHCMGRLKPSDRDLIEARYESAASLESYAGKIGRPVTSLYTTLGRIRGALRKCIEVRLAREGGAA